MEKEIIISIRSKKSTIKIDELDLPGDVKKIGVLEFGFDNNFFNIFQDNHIVIVVENGKEYYKLEKGYYEPVDISRFFVKINKSLKERGKIKENMEIKLVFIKSILKFKIYNNSKYTVMLPQELSLFLKIDSVIPANSEKESYQYFSNNPNRIVYITCDNIKDGELLVYNDINMIDTDANREINTNDIEKINKRTHKKILLSHYVKSEYGGMEMADYFKKIRYYNYIMEDNCLQCVLNVIDENGRPIDYTNDSGIYIKLSLIIVK